MNSGVNSPPPTIPTLEFGQNLTEIVDDRRLCLLWGCWPRRSFRVSWTTATHCLTASRRKFSYLLTYLLTDSPGIRRSGLGILKSSNLNFQFPLKFFSMKVATEFV